MLYPFDGYNILHAGDFADLRQLVDLLASFLAVRGARGHRVTASRDPRGPGTAPAPPR